MGMNDERTTTTLGRLRPERDERLLLYAAVAASSMVVAVLGGGLRIMVIAVPFAVAVALGTRRRDVAPVAVQVSLDTLRCVEGDRIVGRIDIDAPAEFAVEVAVSRESNGVEPTDDRPWAWSIPIGVTRPVGLPFEIDANRWGRHLPGTIDVRLIEHGSLFHRRGPVLDVPMITVLPAGQRLDELLALDSAQVAAGAHAARRLATGGYEFAEVRGYQPGDRLRDLNWSATLRHDDLHVNHRTPERAGDVVIIVDTFPDALRRHSEVGVEMIRWAGRTTWTIASAHLAANDRVGVAIEGARTRWLPPQAGRRAKLVIFDTLLQATTSSGDRGRAVDINDRIHVPPSALVVAVTPLARTKSLDNLVALRAAGHSVEVLALDMGGELASRVRAIPEPVLRLRNLLFAERVASLRRAGLRVTVTRPGDEVGRAIRNVGRARRRIGRVA